MGTLTIIASIITLISIGIYIAKAFAYNSLLKKVKNKKTKITIENNDGSKIEIDSNRISTPSTVSLTHSVHELLHH